MKETAANVLWDFWQTYLWEWTDDWTEGRKE